MRRGTWWVCPLILVGMVLPVCGCLGHKPPPITTLADLNRQLTEQFREQLCDRKPREVRIGSFRENDRPQGAVNLALVIQWNKHDSMTSEVFLYHATEDYLVGTCTLPDTNPPTFVNLVLHFR